MPQSGTQNRLPLIGHLLLLSGGIFFAYTGANAIGTAFLSGSLKLIVGIVALAVPLLSTGGPQSFQAGVRRRLHTLWRLVSGGALSIHGPHANTLQEMGTWTLRGVVVYLMLVFAGGAWTTWTVWTARPAEPAAAVLAGPPANPPAVTLGSPRLDDIAPDTIAYGLGRPTIRLLGDGFDESTEILINGEPHAGGRLVDPTRMVLDLNDEDFRHTGEVWISAGGDSARSDPRSLYVQTGAGVTAAWLPPWRSSPRPLSVEGRLLLLAFLMGGLGGTLASFNSISNYRGEGKLTKSWFLHYWVSPALGAGVAFFLYVVVRAGFLSGTSVEFSADATPWGLVAISGLAGLFYDKTLLKLREVFVTLFNPRDTRAGKLDDSASGTFAITTTSLRAATKGRQYRHKLDATGGQGTLSWEVNPKLPTGLLLDPMTGVITGTPTQSSDLFQYTFTAKDMQRATATATLNFEVR